MRSQNTLIRQSILNQISKSAVPLSVNEIFERLEVEADLATIYRGLRYLEKNKKIVGFSFSCGHERMKRLYYSSDKRHVHFFHCDGCHAFLPVKECNQDNQIPLIEKKYKFKIRSHFLSYSGFCEQCLK